MGGESPPPIIRMSLAMSNFGSRFNQLFLLAGQIVSNEDIGRHRASNMGAIFNIDKSKVLSFALVLDSHIHD